MQFITYVDEAEVVLIDGKLLRANLFLQSRGICALQRKKMYIKQDITL